MVLNLVYGSSDPNGMSENVAYAPYVKREDSEVVRSNEYEMVKVNQRESPPQEVYETIGDGYSHPDQGKGKENLVTENQRESPPHEVYETIGDDKSGHSQHDQGIERRNNHHQTSQNQVATVEYHNLGIGQYSHLEHHY